MTPNILTTHKIWKQIYGKILDLLGKESLKMSRDDKDITFFDIKVLNFRTDNMFLDSIRYLQ